MLGFHLPQTPRFDDQLAVERERVYQIAKRGYRQLAAWQEEKGALAAGVTTALQWVAWDPLDETAWQQLLRFLAYDGRTAEAVTAYERYRVEFVTVVWYSTQASPSSSSLLASPGMACQHAAALVATKCQTSDKPQFVVGVMVRV